MSRKRTPLAVASITGQADARPGRYAGRSDPDTGPLGPAPDWMRQNQRAAWDELAASWPWLRRSDRHLLTIGAKLLAAIKADVCDELGVARINQFRLICAACGGTSADRSRVALPDKEDDDPARKYLT